MSEKLTPNQVADKLGVSRDTVVGWIRAGDLRAADVRIKKSLGGKPRYRIDSTDLDAFWKRRQTTPPPARPSRPRKLPPVIEFIK